MTQCQKLLLSCRYTITEVESISGNFTHFNVNYLHIKELLLDILLREDTDDNMNFFHDLFFQSNYGYCGFKGVA